MKVPEDHTRRISHFHGPPMRPVTFHCENCNFSEGQCAYMERAYAQLQRRRCKRCNGPVNLKPYVRPGGQYTVTHYYYASLITNYFSEPLKESKRNALGTKSNLSGLPEEILKSDLDTENMEVSENYAVANSQLDSPLEAASPPLSPPSSPGAKHLISITGPVIPATIAPTPPPDLHFKTETVTDPMALLQGKENTLHISADLNSVQYIEIYHAGAPINGIIRIGIQVIPSAKYPRLSDDLAEESAIKTQRI